MSAASRTLIIVPALNEEETIQSVLGEINCPRDSFDVLVVDDGSNDRTASIAADNCVEVCSLPFNLGVGGAMRLGFRYALASGYTSAVQLDADGQHDPAQIQSLLDGLSDADIVIGARFAGQGNYKVSALRGLAMKILSRGISAVVGHRLTDTTSGFKAIGPRALQFFANEYPAEYLGDTIEALVSAARAGLTIRQVPVRMRPRAGGVASQPSHRALAHLLRATFALLVSLIRRPTVKFGETQ